MCLLVASVYNCGLVRECKVSKCSKSSIRGNEEKGVEKCLKQRNQAAIKDLRCKTFGAIQGERFRKVCKKCQARKPGTGMGYHGSMREQIDGTVSQ